MVANLFGFPHKSQYQRGTMMSHTNLKRRRNRTLSIEFLESRRVLEKNITGTIHGVLQQFGPGAGVVATATFGCKGDLKHFSATSFFIGSVQYSVNGNGKDITFTSSGTPSLTNEHHQADVINFHFTGTGKVTSKSKSEATFTWNGTVVGGAGGYSEVAHGTVFHAHGHLFGNTMKITATLKVHIKGK
jgi:hypothetical protein